LSASRYPATDLERNADSASEDFNVFGMCSHAALKSKLSLFRLAPVVFDNAAQHLDEGHNNIKRARWITG
jgi:hypothetical protein